MTQCDSLNVNVFCLQVPIDDLIFASDIIDE